MAIELQRAVDQLLAEPLAPSEAEVHLVPPSALLQFVIDDLQDAIYRAEKFDQSHRASDLEMARMIADGGRDR